MQYIGYMAVALFIIFQLMSLRLQRISGNDERGKLILTRSKANAFNVMLFLWIGVWVYEQFAPSMNRANMHYMIWLLFAFAFTAQVVTLFYLQKRI